MRGASRMNGSGDHRTARDWIGCTVVIALVLALALPVRADPVAREQHFRLRSRHGPIHVWHPAGYDPKSAATVVYVHGYFADVDDAWSEYRLRDQFAASELN